MSTPTQTPVVDEVREEGVLLWVVAFGTIALWILHLGVEISLAGHDRGRPWLPWVMHGLTVVLASVAGLATAASYRIVDRHRHDGSQASPDGRIAFVGWLGVFIGACDLTLIVVEGLYLVMIHG